MASRPTGSKSKGAKPAAKAKPSAAVKAKAPAKGDAEESTIAHNPLDMLVSAGAVRQLQAAKKRPAAHHAQPGPTTDLTIRVPQSLADQVAAILEVAPDLSFDQLMSTALAEVLQSIKGRHRGKAASSVKELATTVLRRQ